MYLSRLAQESTTVRLSTESNGCQVSDSNELGRFSFRRRGREASWSSDALHELECAAVKAARSQLSPLTAANTWSVGKSFTNPQF